jgi:hypothetical protein
MTRQTISTGTTGNDATGDSLRAAGTKMNANFSELYTAIGGSDDTLPGNIVLHSNTTVTANGALNLAYSYYILNKATALAITIPNGPVVGTEKTFTNKGVGVATITGNFMGATASVALAQYEGCKIVWDGSEWYVVANQSVLTLA